MNIKNDESNALLSDFYEFTMSNGYFLSDIKDTITYFDIFFRRVPDDGGFAIFSGLESVIDYVKNLSFSKSDIDYLKSKNLFDEKFLKYLENFKFSGDIYSVKEGTPIFPNEPIMTIKAKAIEAQLIETYLLLAINHQSLIATKANRIVRAANGRSVFEFGARRAQGESAAILGARAAYIAGCTGTSCTITDKLYDVSVSGTMAHSWVQMFDDEYTAFHTYCSLYPENSTLLVDTYNVLKKGIPNAIRAFDAVLKPKGIKKCAVRLDSGDMTYLSKKARKMLDDAGYTECSIVASNSLDEHIISDLINQGAKIDIFGVGERLITAKSESVFGGVYKLCALEDKNGNIVPKIKISENIGKITNPHYKKLYRLYNKEDNMAIADLICTYDELIDDTKPLTIFDPVSIWKKKTIENFNAVELLTPIFLKGECVYNSPSTKDIREYCKTQVDTLWDEIKRLQNPHSYYVDLSEKLWKIKDDMLRLKDK